MSDPNHPQDDDILSSRRPPTSPKPGSKAQNPDGSPIQSEDEDLQPSEAAAAAAAAASGVRPATNVKDTRRQSAADALVTRTKSITKHAHTAVTQKKDMTGIIAIVVILLVIAGIVAAGMLFTSKSEATQVQDMKPQFQLNTDDKEELRGFIRKALKEVNDNKADNKELRDMFGALMKRVDSVEDFVKTSNRETLEQFQQISSQKIREIQASGAGVRGGTSDGQRDPRVASVMDKYIDDLIALKLTPEDSRKRALDALHKAGFDERKSKDILAEAAQRAGRIEVGNVAERALQPDERKTVPAEIQPLLDGVQGLLYSFALSEGRLYWDQSKGDITNHLKANIPRAKMAMVTPELVAKVGELCRVRRENLSPEQEDLLPFLIAQRDENRLANTDRDAIGHLVWTFRSRFQGDTTPGQLLSLAQAVSRAIAATTRDKEASGFKPIDEGSLRFAVEYVATAVSTAIAMGKKQDDQYRAAESSLKSYLDTARYTATDEQKRRIIQQAMASGLRRQQGADAVAKPATAPASGLETQSAAKSQEPAKKADPFIYFGPLKADQVRVLRITSLALPGLLVASGFDLTTAKGASALVATWEQLPRFQMERLPKYIGQPNGGRDYLNEVLPELLLLARTGETLGASPLRVATSEVLEKSPQAAVMRGAAIGAVYGPFIHDEKKAVAAASDAIPLIVQQRPFTDDVLRRMQAFVDRPVGGVVLAYDTVRPRRFGWDAERFDAMVARVTELQAQTGDLQNAMGDTMPSEGSFAESAKLFIPFAMVLADDGVQPIQEVSVHARRDLQDYAMLYAAEYLTGVEVRNAIIPKYATSMAGDSIHGGQSLLETASVVVPDLIYRAYEPYRGAVQAQDLPQTAREISRTVLPGVEQALVRSVVLARVLPRIDVFSPTRGDR